MIAIEANNLSKSFDIYKKPVDRIKEILTLKRKQLHQEFWALRDISFSVRSGTTIGVLGQNGSGKSTLLKILAGLMLPTVGYVTVNGKKSSLIELGMGFHSEFSGRSNVYLNSALLGIPKEEIDSKFDQIVEFSGIGDFIDRPVKTYSSGMYLRLAFSVVINIDPEVLLIDEVLAVGDALFSQKCIRKLKEFQEQGVTILFVSHDLGLIKNLCDEAILLDKGLLIERGDPRDVADYYIALIQKRYAEETNRLHFIQRIEDEEKKKRQRYGSFDAAIAKIRVTNSSGEETGAVVSGEECIIMVTAIFFENVEDAVVGFLIRDRFGNDVFGTNTGHHNQNAGPVKKEEIINVAFYLKMDIGPGDYSITAAVHPDEFGFKGHFDWIDRAISLKVFPSEPRFIGLSKLTTRIAIDRMKTADFPQIDNPLNTIFPDAPDHFDMSGDFQKFLIKGWYPVEDWEGASVRWTKKESVFVMKVCGNRMKLEVGTLKPNIQNEPVRGDFFCNGIKVGNFILSEYGWKNFEFNLGDCFLGQVARFKLLIDGTWCPDHFFKNGDKRELAIYVRRIDCK